VQVSLAVLGEVKVNDDVDALDVDSPRKEVARDEMPGSSVPELVEDPVPVGLLHLGVNVEAREPELGDLLREKLDAVHGVAEDDGLVDFEFGEEGVEAVNLLPLLHEGVELADTPEGELVHEVDGVGVGNELLAERLDSDREGCGEHTDLVGGVAHADELQGAKGEERNDELGGLAYHA